MHASRITLSIDNLDAQIGPLFVRYPGMQPQPAFVQLDIDGEVTACVVREIDGGVPGAVVLGRTLRWSVHPQVKGPALAALLRSPRVLALLDRIHAGHARVPTGRTSVGLLDDGAMEACAALEVVLRGLDDDALSPACWNAEEWLFSAHSIFDRWPAGPLEAAVAEIERAAVSVKVLLDGNIARCLLKAAKRCYDDGDVRLKGEHITALAAHGLIEPHLVGCVAIPA